MQTMVVMDERIVRYLLHLVHRYGDTTWPTHGEALHSLTFALSVLEQAKKDSEEKEKS
jgi:hypothetical protein